MQKREFMKGFISYTTGMAGILSPTIVDAGQVAAGDPQLQHLIAVWQLATVVMGAFIVGLRLIYDLVTKSIKLMNWLRSRKAAKP